MVDPKEATTGIEPVFASYRPHAIRGVGLERGKRTTLRLILPCDPPQIPIIAHHKEAA